MFTAMGSFFNRISDPDMGGAYLTLLNTIANMGTPPVLHAAMASLPTCSSFCDQHHCQYEYATCSCMLQWHRCLFVHLTVGKTTANMVVLPVLCMRPLLHCLFVHLTAIKTIANMVVLPVLA